MEVDLLEPDLSDVEVEQMAAVSDLTTTSQAMAPDTEQAMA